jgi:glucose-1-phosphate cytidylyltransferase
MKVVLFCGGMGTRLKEYSETIPKPMVDIGYRPIMWHLMRYYAHFGHKDFILCLGYRGDIIRNYFLSYNEAISNDFIMSNGGKTIQLLNHDIADWTITFVDTGLHANIGQRLKAVQKYLEGEEVFMANYTDGLTDLYLPDYIDFFNQSGKIGGFISVLPSQSFHLVSAREDGVVKKIEPVQKSNLWINAGFFIFKNEIFNNMHEGEELVMEPFYRLIEQQQLVSYKYSGFWACMDTFKEKKMFDDMYACGQMPWAVWETTSRTNRDKNLSEFQRVNGKTSSPSIALELSDPQVNDV